MSGLNPHAGKGGLFGREEIAQITPAIAAVAAEGIDASGSRHGDTDFFRCARGDFDGVVALYHEPGHIAANQAGSKHGADFTAGLPVLPKRSSKRGSRR